MLLPVDTISPRLTSSLWSQYQQQTCTSGRCSRKGSQSPGERLDGRARHDRSEHGGLIEERYLPEMLTVARASRRLIRLLGSQEFPQHPVVTSLAHREC